MMVRGPKVAFVMGIALTAFVVSPLHAQIPVDSSVQLVTRTGTLAGSLLVPKSPTRIPVVLIHAGSGPTDRNGNNPAFSGPNHSLRYLAEALAEAGIASLRFDKRGIAMSQGSMTREADMRFDNYVDDAAGWITQLRADPRFSTITVLGHSEGSLIGMLAARVGKADGYISLAGLGSPAADGIRDQLRRRVTPAMFQTADSILRALEAGQTREVMPQWLLALFRPSVQPYLISWFRYVPTAEVARLEIPVLVVQGTTDIQVGVAEARALAAAKPGAQLEVIEGMNHVLKSVPANDAVQIASYSDSTLGLTPRLAKVVSEFVRRVPARAR